MVRLDGLRKDCVGFCQEVERVGSGLDCAGSLCLKVLHCNQFQSLTLTTLYRHTVGICRIVDRLQVAVVILVLVLSSLRCSPIVLGFEGLLRIAG